MKKRILAAILSGLLALSICSIGAAAEPSASETDKTVDVRVNGYLVSFPDIKPFINDDQRTLIPVRFVTEALGAKVSYDKTIPAAIIEQNGIKLTVPIDKQEMTVEKNGTTSAVTLDTAAILKDNSRTMVPIRAVAEALGAWVSYSNYDSTVLIYKDVLTPAEINELHSIKDRSTKNYLPDVFCGQYYFENENEYLLRNAYPKIPCSIVGETSRDWSWTKGKDDPSKLYPFVCKEIRANESGFYTDDDYGVTAVYRTDPSCIFALQGCPEPGLIFCARGYLTITTSPNADIQEYKSLLNCAKFGDIQPGHTYTYITEVDGFLDCQKTNGSVRYTHVTQRLLGGQAIYWG